MDDRAIRLPWDKNFVLTPPGQTVVYGELREFYKGIRRYPSISIPPETDTEKSSIGGTLIKWNSPFDVTVETFTSSHQQNKCMLFTVKWTQIISSRGERNACHFTFSLSLDHFTEGGGGSLGVFLASLDWMSSRGYLSILLPKAFSKHQSPSKQVYMA